VTDGSTVAFIGVEDLIADRLGQDCSDPHTGRPEMRAQAALLYRLAERLNRSYLDKRIREETHNRYSLADLERLADDADHHL
jgi:hypothetical protein